MSPAIAVAVWLVTFHLKSPHDQDAGKSRGDDAHVPVNNPGPPFGTGVGVPLLFTPVGASTVREVSNPHAVIPADITASRPTTRRWLFIQNPLSDVPPRPITK